MSGDKRTVLFLCSGNVARSQMAEAILRHLAPDDFEVFSAGLNPLPHIHPSTLRVLDEIGIDTSTLRPKGLEEFLGKRLVHHAIVVCEEKQDSCPRLYAFATDTLHWPFPDPAGDPETDEEERLERFRRTRDAIFRRIRAWIAENG